VVKGWSFWRESSTLRGVRDPEPGPANGFNEGGAGLAELLSNVPDMDIDDARSGIEVHPPDLLQKSWT
jgi:hypothetical protein